ncbi:sporulation protein [Kitasatospora sp. NPDC094028]
MDDESRRPAGNADLARIFESSGYSRKALAHRVNQLARDAGLSRQYTHTSVLRWLGGLPPRQPIPALVAAALGERLGRHLTEADIGMAGVNDPLATMGLDFPRDPTAAVRGATAYWSNVHRRQFLASTGFAVSAYATPVTRWLAVPEAAPPPPRGTRFVGQSDVEELWAAADDARRQDSRFGGGHWKASSVSQCLTQQAVPLLNGRYSEVVGKNLFSATAELSRVVGWSAVDTGHHDAAQRYFIQALAMARAGGDVQAGSYILGTMALQTLLAGDADKAVDMAQGAYDRGKRVAAPRVLAFIKLMESRAHARLGDAPAASAALRQSEQLLESIRPGTRDPDWLAYFTHERIAADATEIYRDLRNPRAALAWNRQADTMPQGSYTRSVGMRLAIVGTAYLQQRDLDRGLHMGREAVSVLGQVHSPRARSYVLDLIGALEPWRTEPRVLDFIHHARAGLAHLN